MFVCLRNTPFSRWLWSLLPLLIVSVSPPNASAQQGNEEWSKWAISKIIDTHVTSWPSFGSHKEQVLLVVLAQLEKENSTWERAKLTEALCHYGNASHKAAITAEIFFQLDQLERWRDVFKFSEVSSRGTLTMAWAQELEMIFTNSFYPYFEKYPDKGDVETLVRISEALGKNGERARRIIAKNANADGIMELLRSIAAEEDDWRHSPLHDLLESLDLNLVEWILTGFSDLPPKQQRRRAYSLELLTQERSQRNLPDDRSSKPYSISRTSLKAIASLSANSDKFVRFKIAQTLQNLVASNRKHSEIDTALSRLANDEDPSVKHVASQPDSVRNEGVGLVGNTHKRNLGEYEIGDFKRTAKTSKGDGAIEIALEYEVYEYTTPIPSLNEPIMLRLIPSGETVENEEGFSYSTTPSILAIQLELYDESGEFQLAPLIRDGRDEICYYIEGVNFVQYANDNAHSDNQSETVAYINLLEAFDLAPGRYTLRAATPNYATEPISFEIKSDFIDWKVKTAHSLKFDYYDENPWVSVEDEIYLRNHLGRPAIPNTLTPISEGRLFVGGQNGVQLFDLKNGGLLWQLESRLLRASIQAESEKELYVLMHPYYDTPWLPTLLKMDKESGKVLEKGIAELQDKPPFYPFVRRDSFGADATWDRSENFSYSLFEIFSESELQLLFSHQDIQWLCKVSKSPIVLGARLYPEKRDNIQTLIALSLESGEIIWEREHRGLYRVAAYEDNRIYGIGGDLACLDASSGDLLWQSEYLGDNASLTVGDNALYTFSTGSSVLDGGVVKAFDKETGRSAWGISSKRHGPKLTACTAEGTTVYLSDENGRLLQLEDIVDYK